MIKTIRSILIAVTFIALILFALLGYKIYQMAEFKAQTKQSVLIKKGTSIKEIANILEEKELIQDRYVFEYYLRVVGKANKLKAGEYEFVAGVNMHDIINQMVEGKVKKYRFTIPEGFAIKDICETFQKKNIMTRQTCLNLTKNTNLLKESKNIKNLEGYLFPDTYYYEKESTPEDIIEEMVKLFYRKINPEKTVIIQKRNMSLHELVILASMIEKETSVDEERPLVAGVFYNRLKKGMLLQSDPTVIYGIKDYDGNIRRKDLENDTPYNTYTRPGLPIGPICNPGLASIEAATEPKETDHLYFVATGDGGHHFSKTLEEHNQAVRKYQLKK